MRPVIKFNIYIYFLTGISLLGSIIALFQSYERFIICFLEAFLFFSGISVTCLFFISLQQLVRARWGSNFQKIALNFSRFVPFILIPLLLIIADILIFRKIFNPSSKELIISSNSFFNLYTNPYFYSARLIVYYITWLFLYLKIKKHFVSPEEKSENGNKYLPYSGSFIILYVLSFSFAGIDLVILLQNGWMNTIWSIYYISGSYLTVLAVIALFSIVYEYYRKETIATKEEYHNISKMIFGFTIFWGYIAYSQYFLIWYVNQPTEVSFFANRINSSIGDLGLFLITMRFAIPFLLLLSAKNKRNKKLILISSITLLVSQLIDIIWMEQQSMDKDLLQYGWENAAIFILFLCFFILRIKPANIPTTINKSISNPVV